jgi:hypothetical protein
MKKQAALIVVSLLGAPSAALGLNPTEQSARAQSQPCIHGQRECQAGEAEWWLDDPEAAPKRAKQVERKQQSGPAFLVIATPQAIRTVPYKTMAACERARSYAAGPPAGTRLSNGAILGPPLVTYQCVPR